MPHQVTSTWNLSDQELQGGCSKTSHNKPALTQAPLVPPQKLLQRLAPCKRATTTLWDLPQQRTSY